MKKNLIIMAFLLIALTIGVTSCKAWRTVTTTATCIQSADSLKTTTTISTKMVEEYTGVKKK